MISVWQLGFKTSVWVFESLYESTLTCQLNWCHRCTFYTHHHKPSSRFVIFYFDCTSLLLNSFTTNHSSNSLFRKHCLKALFTFLLLKYCSKPASSHLRRQKFGSRSITPMSPQQIITSMTVLTALTFPKCILSDYSQSIFGFTAAFQSSSFKLIYWFAVLECSYWHTRHTSHISP